MRPIFAHGRKAAIAKLLELRRQAQQDKEPRALLRIRGILMSLDGHTASEIADHLKVHRSTVPLWIDQWNRYGKEGLLEGHRSGRPTALSEEDRERLCDILDSGPVAYRSIGASACATSATPVIPLPEFLFDGAANQRTFPNPGSQLIDTRRATVPRPGRPGLMRHLHRN